MKVIQLSVSSLFLLDITLPCLIIEGGKALSYLFLGIMGVLSFFLLYWTD